MPCCGLTEYRRRVPFRFTAAGCLVFWGGFLLAVAAGLVLCWRPWGRGVLRRCAAFLSALWRDTMRRPRSMPARWACRISGRMLPWWPAAAGYVFRHPEAPVLAVLLLVIAVVGGVVWACSF